MNLHFSFSQEFMSSASSHPILHLLRYWCLCSQKISFPFELWQHHLWPLFLKVLAQGRFLLACISAQAVFGIVFLNAGYQSKNKLHLHRNTPQSFSDVFPPLLQMWPPGHSLLILCPFSGCRWTSALHDCCCQGKLRSATASEDKLWGWSIEDKEKRAELMTQRADFRSKVFSLDWCPWPLFKDKIFRKEKPLVVIRAVYCSQSYKWRKVKFLLSYAGTQGNTSYL